MLVASLQHLVIISTNTKFCSKIYFGYFVPSLKEVSGKYATGNRKLSDSTWHHIASLLSLQGDREPDGPVDQDQARKDARVLF